MTIPTEEEKLRSIIREELAINNNHLEHRISEIMARIPFGVYMGEGAVLTRAQFGTFYLVSSHDSIVSPHLIRYGIYETELTKYLLNVIKEDMVFVDVGANIGYYTCLVAQRIKKEAGGKVFAFEPNQTAFNLLQRNIILNWISSPVVLEQVAASDREGEVTFKGYKYRHVMSHFYMKEENEDINKAEITTIKTIRLDDYFQDDQRIDYLKIDVEGAEYHVLQGAKKIIDKNVNIKILLEWSMDQLQNLGTKGEDIVNFLKSRRFKPHYLDWRDGSVINLTYEEILNTGYFCSILLHR